MSSPALRKTRIALGVLMATATLATTGIATTLALTRTPSTAHNTNVNTAANTADSSQRPTARAGKQKSTTSQGFAPASPATSTTSPSHTRTKGS